MFSVPVPEDFRSKESKFPEVSAIFVVGKGYQQWKVEKCPFCGKVHVHGAGSEGDDPYGFLGHRLTHCGDGVPDNNGYILVAKSPEQVKEATMDRMVNNQGLMDALDDLMFLSQPSDPKYPEDDVIREHILGERAKRNSQ